MYICRLLHNKFYLVFFFPSFFVGVLDTILVPDKSTNTGQLSKTPDNVQG